ncbi:MAG: L,D-transpeptidase family protein [Oscillospiraceae bacterium]
MTTKTKVEEKSITEAPKKKFVVPLIIAACILVGIAAFVIFGAVYGSNKYEDKFIPNTYINEFDVSGKTLEETKELLSQGFSATELVITKRDGTAVKIPLTEFDYKYDTNEKLEEIYKQVNHSKWYKGLFDKTKYELKSEASYDKTKLEAAIKAADWGKEKNQNAQIVKGENGFEIKPEVQGDNMDYDKLHDYILAQVDKEVLEIKAEDSDCYIEPTIKSEDLTDTLKRFEQAYNQKITFDFDYTTETLTGDDIAKMLKIGKKGEFGVDSDKAMEYVEELAKKYDTYNTKRKFKATIQGNIIVPTSTDAKYGWWIDQEKTCDLIVDLIKKGEDVEKIDPIYYVGGRGYVFTGREEARTADDDIGNTYVEIDLTNQHLWYYKDGKKMYECDIVSGQTTSAARTTLPGVYKVWHKLRNYKMKGSNEDGEEWESTCSYWTRVAIVGIGLHDSQWRGGYFGGNIYKYNGSHGCINMPLNGAKYIYENVEMDTPVVMYY